MDYVLLVAIYNIIQWYEVHGIDVRDGMGNAGWKGRLLLRFFIPLLIPIIRDRQSLKARGA
jgi:hypothetical protein